ncbi:MAG: cation:proton antiporter [Candidatus Omnitrophota bacterium]
MNTLLLIGLAVFLGVISGKFFQRIKIPQVVGYILIGLFIGKSFLHIFEGPVIEGMMPVVNFTLGIIGFIIGGYLKRDVFSKYGRSVYAILLGEGILAFFLVAAVVTLITKKLYLGLLFGAIASATDPASTTSVLWEYRSKGPLTTTLASIVALDDGLAILLYGFASVFAKAMVTKESFSLLHSFGLPLWEICQCVILGCLAGFLVSKSVLKIRERELVIAFILGTVGIVAGVSLWLRLDLILSCMALGTFVANSLPKKSEPIFASIREMSAALYILFFVVVGSQLNIQVFFQTTLLLTVLGYLLSRSAGKIFGSMLGGKIGGARPEVSRYSGIALMTQGGVAMGLALSISQNMAISLPVGGKEIAVLIMNVVAATTFIVQLIGPPLVKLAVTRCNETFKDVTREDIVNSLSVKDVMQTDFVPVSENSSLGKVIQAIKEGGTDHSPVFGPEGRHIGSIALNNLKEALYEEELKDLLLAGDIAVPDQWVVTQAQSLKEAMEIFEERYIDYIPVIESQESPKVIGVLEYPSLIQVINRKMLV